MCTALTLKTKDGCHLFGRNVDVADDFNQSVMLIPRNYTYVSRITKIQIKIKYAMIGMGIVVDGNPVLADGLNEQGLAVAVLYLPDYTEWNQAVVEGKVNLCPCNVAAWILSNCGTLEDVKLAFKELNIIDQSVVDGEPAGLIHWMVTDKSGKSIVIEKTRGKLSIYNNKIGVLTNAPTFDWHVTNLNRYLKLEPNQPIEVKWGQQKLKPFSQGFGGIELPGDFSSPSRFVKTAFLRNNAVVGENESSAVNEMFHILNSVAMVKGNVISSENQNYITHCTTCMSQEKGIYYYNTYNNNQINAISLYQENLNQDGIKVFPYRDQLMINYENFSK